MKYESISGEKRDDLFIVPIDFNNLSVDRKEIELTLGYLENQIPPHFSDLLDEVIVQLPKRCSIKAGYRIADVERSESNLIGLTIAGTFFTMDKIVTGQLKKSEKAALFVCSIGSSMEKWARQLLLKGDPVMSYLVDTVASLAVESVTNYLHDHLETEMESVGLRITNRYSPGYCNWSVAEQHLLFSFFPKNFCGVTLTESSLMIPIKSVSGIIGIGHNVKRKEYSCDKCGVKDCTYRAARLSKSPRNSG